MIRHVIIDTCILEGDWLLTKTQLHVILTSAEKLGYKVHVPEVVVRELLKHHQEVVQKNMEDISGNVDKWNNINFPEYSISPFSFPNLDELCERYNIEFRKQLALKGICIDELPHISHDKLVDKAIYRRKPFQSGGKGYQDALIWENVKQCATGLENIDDEVIFVTKNTKDFSDNDTLHADLRAELKQNNLPEDCVRLLTDYDSVVKKMTILLEKLGGIEQKIKKQCYYKDINFESDLEQIFDRETLFDKIHNQEADQSELLWSSRKEEPYIENTYDIKLEDVQVNRLPSTDYLIQINSCRDADIRYYIYRGDIEDDDWMHIGSDWDPDEYYVEVEACVTFRVQVIYVIDECFKKIKSMDVKYKKVEMGE